MEAPRKQMGQQNLDLPQSNAEINNAENAGWQAEVWGFLVPKMSILIGCPLFYCAGNRSLQKSKSPKERFYRWQLHELLFITRF